MKANNSRLHSEEIRRVEHLQRVYKDIDFITEVSALRRVLEHRYGSGVSFQVAPVGIAVYHQTGLSYVKEKEDQDRVTKLAKSWFMSLDDLVYFADGYSGKKNKKLAEDKRVTIINGKRRIRVQPIPFYPLVQQNKNIKVTIDDDGVVTLQLRPLATQDDVIKAWPSVESAKQLAYGPKRKKKVAEDYNLIYAISKARKSGKGYFKNILALQ